MEQLMVKAIYLSFSSLPSVMEFFKFIYYATYFFPVIFLYFLRGKDFTKFILVLAISALIAVGLKFSIMRERPYQAIGLEPVVYKENDPSFPSMHSVVYFSIALFIRQRGRIYDFFRFLFWFIFPFSLVAIAVHYPSDVAGSLALVYTVYYLVNRKFK